MILLGACGEDAKDPTIAYVSPDGASLRIHQGHSTWASGGAVISEGDTFREGQCIILAGSHGATLIVPASLAAQDCQFSAGSNPIVQITPAVGRSGSDFVVRTNVASVAEDALSEINSGHIAPEGGIDEISYIELGKRVTLRPVGQTLININRPPLPKGAEMAAGSAADSAN